MNPKVDWFFTKASQWHKEFAELRRIILECDLKEELKWGHPCYMFQKSNIVLIHGFRDYCAVLFFKGALLKDPKKILVRQTENVQAARQIRFTNVVEIKKLERALKAFVYQAVGLEEKGVKVQLKKTAEFKMPEEFQKKLKQNRPLKIAFDNLTPGRQRGYLLYFSQAKRSTTRETRIEKSIAGILEGKGLND
jgi:uncharacterized protein YdeI (YjbR/CyaY-like superfamily)